MDFISENIVFILILSLIFEVLILYFTVKFAVRSAQEELLFNVKKLISLKIAELKKEGFTTDELKKASLHDGEVKRLEDRADGMTKEKYMEEKKKIESVYQ